MKNNDRLSSVIGALQSVSASDHKYFKKEELALPSAAAVRKIAELAQYVMFPWRSATAEPVSDAVHHLHAMLSEQIAVALRFVGVDVGESETLAAELLGELPRVKHRLYNDAIAIYEGDPAAISPEEVILCYPGFYAIAIYRLAHEFYLRHIPFIDRMLTELAHERTGIDIHPGATIGEHFCIDHGTGIVIGETAIIGDSVKIYQGVTIGAKSFELGDDGNPVKGIKRHPDIGNNVVIYANATILGGDTKIGDGAVIGGNVWVTESVPEGSRVYYGKSIRQDVIKGNDTK